jgi:3,4-dihydroxy 2-butanone 4-phosphate synthase / GTP cyclohydrolase II
VLLYVVQPAYARLKRSFDRIVLKQPAPALGPTDSSEALRDFGLGAQVLADLGCKRVRLMIWSDRKLPGLEGFGIEVVERVKVPARPRVVTSKPAVG